MLTYQNCGNSFRSISSVENSSFSSLGASIFIQEARVSSSSNELSVSGICVLSDENMGRAIRGTLTKTSCPECNPNNFKWSANCIDGSFHFTETLPFESLFVTSFQDTYIVDVVMTTEDPDQQEETITHSIVASVDSNSTTPTPPTPTPPTPTPPMPTPPTPTPPMPTPPTPTPPTPTPPMPTPPTPTPPMPTPTPPGPAGHSYRFSVEEPKVVLRSRDMREGVRIGDLRLFVLPSSNGKLYGYTGNEKTYLLEGTSVENLRFISRPYVIDKGRAGSFDECGAWMDGAFYHNGVYRGWYHAESDCNYNNNSQSYASIAYAESDDAGRTFKRDLVDYPRNQILIGDTSPEVGTFRGNGNGSIIKRGNYFYFYFLSLEPRKRKVGVARSLLSDNGLPGKWKKYYRGQWNSRGIGGKVDDLDHNQNAPGAVASQKVDTGEVMLVGPKSNGFQYAFSRDGIRFTGFNNDPLIFFDSRDWQRRRPVYEYYHSSRKDHRYSANPDFRAAGYERRRSMGFSMKKIFRGTQQLFSCRLPNGKYTVSVAGCSEGTSSVSIGHIYAERPGNRTTSPLYLCHKSGDNDYFLSHHNNCGGGESRRIRSLGYIPQEPAGDLLSYPSVVAPGGGNEFSSEFYIFYTFTRRAEPIHERTIVRRKVKIEEDANPRFGSKVRIKLMRYYSSRTRDHWTTTRLPRDEYLERSSFMGWIYTNSFSGSRKLVDCLVRRGQRHVVRTGQCRSGETFLRTIGWIHSGNAQGLRPLYQCKYNSLDNYLTGHQLHCGDSKYTEGSLLGYIDKRP